MQNQHNLKRIQKGKKVQLILNLQVILFQHSNNSLNDRVLASIVPANPNLQDSQTGGGGRETGHPQLKHQVEILATNTLTCKTDDWATQCIIREKID